MTGAAAQVWLGEQVNSFGWGSEAEGHCQAGRAGEEAAWLPFVFVVMCKTHVASKKAFGLHAQP